MAINNYTNLSAAIANWLARSDLTSAIDDFIDLAETRIYSELRLRFMEEAYSVSTATTAALPTDFLEWKYLYTDGTPTQWIDIKPAQWIYQHYEIRSAEGKPQFAAMDDETLIFGPYPDGTYTIKGTYYMKQTALSASNETNWLTNNAPDLILFGALLESAPYIGDDARMMLWQARYEQAIERVKKQEKNELYPRHSQLRTTTG